MKFIIVLAAVAACAYSNSIPSRSYSESEDTAVLEEVEVDDFEGSDRPSDDEIVLQELSNSVKESDESELSGPSSLIEGQVDEVVGQIELSDLPEVSLQTEEQDEGDPEETEFPNLPGIPLQTEEQDGEESEETEFPNLPGISLQTEEQDKEESEETDLPNLPGISLQTEGQDKGESEETDLPNLPGISLQTEQQGGGESEETEFPNIPGISLQTEEQDEGDPEETDFPNLPGISLTTEVQSGEDPEDTEFPNLPGISLTTGVQSDEDPEDTELPALSVETEVIIGEPEYVLRQEEDDVESIAASLPISQLLQATAYNDRLMIIADLTNLNNAILGEKKAFDNMISKTSEMKMTNKTACLQDAINQVITVSVDATKLNTIQANLTTMYQTLQNGNYDNNLLEVYKEQILTGNNTFITQILNEGKLIAENMEEAIDTMVIDQKC